MAGRPLRGILLTLLLLCPCFNDAQAQDAQGWFGSGHLGPLRQDDPALARARGISVLGRVGHSLGRQVAWLGELGWLSTTKNTDVSFASCEPSVGCFGGDFIGPTSVVTLGANLRVMSPPGPVQAYLTAGPALFWATQREPGARAFGGGWSAGGGLMVHATARTALLADVGYRRLGTTGSSPRWLVPITVGVELR